MKSSWFGSKNEIFYFDPDESKNRNFFFIRIKKSRIFFDPDKKKIPFFEPDHELFMNQINKKNEPESFELKDHGNFLIQDQKKTWSGFNTNYDLNSKNSWSSFDPNFYQKKEVNIY